jgi:purine-binding chemotaxis protein CheW
MNINKMNKLVVFHLDEQQFALHLSNVERIIHSIEIHPMPMAPEHISGIINYQGEFLPVVNIRKLFRLPVREIELTDQLIIANTDKNRLVLWVDSVDEIATMTDEEIANTDKILLDSGYVEGLFKLRDKIVLIHDLDKFITPEQIVKLKDAIQKQLEKQD